MEKLSHGAKLSEEEMEHLIEASKQVKDAMKDEGDTLVKTMASKSQRQSIKQQDSALVFHAQNPVGSSMSSEAVVLYKWSDPEDVDVKVKATRLSSRMQFVSNPQAESAPKGAEKLLVRAEVYLTLGMDDPTFEKYRNAEWMAKSAMLFKHVPTPGESRAAGMAAAMEKAVPSTALRAKLSLVVQTAQSISTVKTLAALASKPVANLADRGMKTALGGADAAMASVGLHQGLSESYEFGLGKIKLMLASKREAGQVVVASDMENRRPAPH